MPKYSVADTLCQPAKRRTSVLEPGFNRASGGSRLAARLRERSTLLQPGLMQPLPEPLVSKTRIATTRDVRSWSSGAITAVGKTATGGWEERRGSLHDERIFGPTRDFECACGKYRGTRHKGMICDRCGVKITTVDARRK